MCEYGWGDLLPASNKGSILDVQGGCKAEASVGDGRKELDVVLRCECGVVPLFVEVDGHVVEGGGCGGVDAHGAGGKS